jgi:di/tricarboxylate transporter
MPQSGLLALPSSFSKDEFWQAGMSYSESFQKELPGIAELLRLSALAGLIILLMMANWNYAELNLSSGSSEPIFKIAGVAIFFAALATFFQVLGDSKIKKKKTILGILILVGGQFAPFLNAYKGEDISGVGAIPLIADFIALAWVSILVRCFAHKACKDACS